MITKNLYKAGIALALIVYATAAAMAQDRIVILDEDAAGVHEASDGSFVAPDTLRLEDGRLPVTERAFSGTTSGLLEYRHTTGRWEMVVGREGFAPADITGSDSLVVYLNGPDALPGSELPRIALEDADGGRTEPAWLSAPENVTIDDEATGFTPESETNAILLADYVNVLPPSQRRPGYPEDLTITFADVPVDTSREGIGAPSTPAKFSIVTNSGMPVEFRLRDTAPIDSTLSRTDEYIEVLLPVEEGSDDLVPAWRFTIAPTQGPDPLIPPGEGDVYHLALTFEEFALDDDAGSWQRLSLPLDELLASGDFDRTAFRGVVFLHGGTNPAVRTLWFDLLTLESNDDEAFLDLVQELTFRYFWEEANPSNGLIKDRSTPNSASSIAAVGFGLSAITVGIDRGWISREQGRSRVLTTLRFFWNAPQSTASDATGYQGFFYHFLNMQTGRRAGTTELSTIDTALLLAGVLHVGEYFDGADAEEAEIRTLSDAIYERVDWPWAQVRPPAISHGWYPDPAGRPNADPESGFIVHDWIGYNEAMILYILALGSPTHPVEPDAWDTWVRGYDAQWQTQYGYTFLTFPPLFGHQYSHVWVDFRGIQDEYMREKGIDYFENSRRATLAQRAYHIANLSGYPNYGKDEWGLTASDTPTGYRARGAPPPQNDDGTLVPTAPGGSIVFTPEESIAALRTMYRKYPALWGPYGFRDAYNVSEGWFDDAYLGIDQGPILLMIENYRTESIWDLMMRHEAVRNGLKRAGFTGQGLAAEDESPAGAFSLAVFPNPVSGTVHVLYELTEAGPVRLELYDVLGRRVHVLARGPKAPGTHRYEADVSRLAAGTYFLMLETPAGRLGRPISVIP